MASEADRRRLRQRDLRIDWAGPLTEEDRDGHLRGPHSLGYTVTDADIFVVGERGEHWHKPARNFEWTRLDTRTAWQWMARLIPGHKTASLRVLQSGRMRTWPAGNTN